MKKIISLILIFIVIVTTTGCSQAEENALKEDTGKGLYVNSNEDMMWVKMFYWDHQADLFLVKEIPVQSFEDQQVLNAIIQDEEFIGNNIIPYANIVVEDYIATVDIPSIIINGNEAPGDKIVADTLSSLAHTLCVNPELRINKVQYLLDGHKIDYIGPSSTDTPFSLPSNWTDVYMK